MELLLSWIQRGFILQQCWRPHSIIYRCISKGNLFTLLQMEMGRILQYDNDSKHTGKDTNDWLIQYNVEVIK